MTTVFFKTKEYKDILKTFSKFSNYAQQKPVVTVSTDPIELIMSTEQAFISAKPALNQASVIPPVNPYSFDPTVLMSIPVAGEEVALFWDQPDKPLQIKNENRFSMDLNVAVPTPSFEAIPQNMKSFEVPLGILVAINRFLCIPFSMATNDNKEKDVIAITLTKNPDGCLTALTDDGFCMSRVDTMYKIDMDGDFNVNVPKYMFDCLYSKADIKDDTLVKIGVEKNKVLLTTGTIRVFTSGLIHQPSAYNQFMEAFKPVVTFDFIPKVLCEAIKPLVSLIPKKERTGTILYVRLKDKVLSLDVSHNHIGKGYVEEVSDIDNIYYENSANSAKIMMHPIAFHEFTNIFSVDKGTMSADSKRIHYKGHIEAGGEDVKVEYIYTTVSY